MARNARIPGNAAAAPAAPRASRRRPIGLSALRGFESAARHLSFTAAAAEMHLTQSAISRQVAALESELGHRLFIRRTRALSLAPAGERLLRSARQALELVDRTVDEIRGQTSAARIVLTTYTSFASLWLLPRLAAFQRLHPGVELRVDASNHRVNLEAEGVDIALRRCPAHEAPAGAIALVDEDVSPALSPELQQHHGGRLRTPADLLRLPLIEVDDDLPGDAVGTWAHWFAVAGVEVAPDAKGPVMIVGYFDQSLQAAVRGQGAVLARSPFRDDLVAQGQLVLPYPDIRAPTGYCTYLLVNSQSRERKPVAELGRWLIEEFARAPARRR